MIQFTPEQTEQLDALQSNAAFTTARRSENPNVPQAHFTEYTQCSLVSRLTGEKWHTEEVEALGDDGTRLSLDAALNSANPMAKPRDVGEIAAENIELRRKLAELTGEDIDNTLTGPVDQQSVQPGEPPAPPLDVEDSPYHNMSTSELAGLLAGHGEPVPTGDRRNKAWREEVVQKIMAIDQATEVAGKQS